MTSAKDASGAVSDEELQAQAWLPACLTGLLANVSTLPPLSATEIPVHRMHLCPSTQTPNPCVLKMRQVLAGGERSDGGAGL